MKYGRSRLAKNYTQNYMADELGLTQSQYSRIENGECSVDFNRVAQIAKTLEINLMDIIDWGDTQQFYNCNQAGNNNTMNNYQEFESERKAYLAQIEELKQDKEFLKEQIKFLNEKYGIT
ncbi:MAG: helix-turn-helix transcriptional regulator [Prevotellaceae bacterium]|jgi:transcriptional regulator with XRE-family HTH domain|nr:helix-turn-helix transcriptional regulator [Prevotellaceae bacterium]